MGLRPFPQYGPRGSEVGAGLDSATPAITSPVHHVITTATLTTLTPPLVMLKDVLEVILIADSVFSWTTSGNIAAPRGTTVVANHAVKFVYDRNTGKWYAVGDTY
jgi:hypothetical protein